jgi:AhpD family alkylhydroperoxidase
MYDMASVKKIKSMKEAAPDVMAAFTAFDAAAFADGAIPSKTKELIAIAVAVTTQCPYCIEIHAKRAKAAGCTDAEITEASMVAAAIRAGGAVTHATHAIG